MQIGVQVSPLVIELRAIMKLKMTVTSTNTDRIPISTLIVVCV